MNNIIIKQQLDDKNFKSIFDHEANFKKDFWRRYLESINVKDSFNGVILFSDSNYNYILFPTGEIYENFGILGDRVMGKIREIGWKSVLSDVKRRINDLK